MSNGLVNKLKHLAVIGAIGSMLGPTGCHLIFPYNSIDPDGGSDAGEAGPEGGSKDGEADADLLKLDSWPSNCVKGWSYKINTGGCTALCYADNGVKLSVTCQDKTDYSLCKCTGSTETEITNQTGVDYEPCFRAAEKCKAK